ncbi:MAG: gliding motility-associated C-terminal domain-containing protein [Lewinellaceae bacterium]|nr:gliding motility-associated C-terminal domain-containing protein [Lewinellaceae bacterium]
MKQAATLTAALLIALGSAAQPIFTLSEEEAPPYEQVAVDFTVQNFTDIYRLRCYIRWDPQVIQLDSAGAFGNVPGLGQADFDYSNAAQGTLIMDWQHPDFPNTGLNLPDGESFQQLLFRPVGGVGDYSAVSILPSLQDTLVVWRHGAGTTNIGAILEGGSVTVGSCRERDSLALVDLYNATHENGVWMNEWDLNLSMDTWYGVSLNEDGCVIILDLDVSNDELPTCCDGIGLAGRLVDIQLPSLQKLFLGYNDLYDSIPDFSNLYNLKEFSCNGNNLIGGIPDFSNLPNLEWFDCSSNFIDGVFPDFSNIPKLKYIRCINNSLRGNIPDFSNLPVLESFNCASNEIDSFPDFSNLPLLEFFYCSNNEINHRLPDFSNLESLAFFSCSFNQITDSIPDFSNLENLELFDCSSNKLTGSIPDFSGAPNLQLFSCLDNQLSGTVPNLSDNCTVLKRFYYGQNGFTFSSMLSSLPANELLVASNATAGLDSIRYAPQDSIFTDTLITRSPGESLTIDLGIDDTVTTNRYQWYKDGQPYTLIAGNNELTFNSLQPSDAGAYWVHVTNPGAPELTLYSRIIEISVLPVSACSRQSDSLALVELYNATHENGQWTNEWNLSQPMDSWYGVDLNGEGCVTSLNVSSNGLGGELPDLNLPALEFFECSNNQLSGTIPDFSNMPSLEAFSCSVNQFSGTIPDFANLPNLLGFSCENNELRGSIPNFSNLSFLEYFNCGDNELSGSIPVFSNLSNLRAFLCQNNNLSGDIPDYSNNCPNLQRFYHNNNQYTFEGILPNIATNDLFIQNNAVQASDSLIYAPQDSIFTDTLIPRSPGESLAIGLGIDDTVTTNLYQWYKDGQSYALITGNNELTFDNLQNSDAGRYWVHVTNPNAPELTLYSRTITLAVGGCAHPDYDALMAFYNAAGGPGWSVNDGWAEGAAEQDCDPCTWYGIECNGEGRVTCIDLDGIPDCLGNPTGGNNLTGTLPPELGSLQYLEYLHLQGNALGGGIPPELGNLGRLFSLDLSDNNLAGSIPPQLGGLDNLIFARLGNNNLSGAIPPELGNSPRLVALDLGENNLSGTIPPELGGLENLEILALSFNELEGGVPPELGDLRELSSLFLNDNNLTGNIPPELANLDSLRILALGNNQLQGSIPPELSNLSNLADLGLYANQLGGTIPPELGGMSNLENLLLNDNQLTGAIPPELGNLPTLDYLQLQNNQLSGCYPDNLANLCAVPHLDFSNNPELPWQGDFAPFCAGQDQIGATCDDADGNTFNDAINTDCSCGCLVGSAQLDTLICRGESVLFAGQLLDSGGLYADTLATDIGCDSIVLLFLAVQPDTFAISSTLCPGEEYFFDNTLITTPGQYTQFHTSQAGCDSIVVLTLEVVSADAFHAEDDELTLPPGQAQASLSVVANDQLPAGGWSIELLESPAHGLATLYPDGQLEYMPASPAFAGTDSLTYQICTDVCIDTCVQARAYFFTLRDCQEELEAHLPTGFTPDGDGVNDEYDPLAHVRDIGCLQDPQNAEMTVVSRWGEVVYEAAPYQPWDGRAGQNGKVVPQGVYYFILRFTLGEEMVVRGVVHVLGGR